MSFRTVEKKRIPADSAIERTLQSWTEPRTAGDSDEPQIVFTDLTPTRLEERLADLGTPACDDTIREWMDDHDLRLRKLRKVQAGGASPDRDAQFVNIAQLIEQDEQAGNPYFSVDTKAKEFQGHLFCKGRVRCNRAFEAFAHDCPSWADGVLIPHGISEPCRPRGHLNLGLRGDWNRLGKQGDLHAASLLLLLECGGRNSATTYFFQHDRQAVVNVIGIDNRVAHYPS